MNCFAKFRFIDDTGADIGKIQTSSSTKSLKAMSWSIRGDQAGYGSELGDQMGLLKNDNQSAMLSDREIIIGAKYANDFNEKVVNI